MKLLKISVLLVNDKWLRSSSPSVVKVFLSSSETKATFWLREEVIVVALPDRLGRVCGETSRRPWQKWKNPNTKMTTCNGRMVQTFESVLQVNQKHTKSSLTFLFFYIINWRSIWVIWTKIMKWMSKLKLCGKNMKKHEPLPSFGEQGDAICLFTDLRPRNFQNPSPTGRGSKSSAQPEGNETVCCVTFSGARVSGTADTYTFLWR